MQEARKALTGCWSAIEEPDAAERGQHADGHDEREGVVVVVVEAGGPHGDGGDEADDGERGDTQCQSGVTSAAGALLEVARDFDGEPESAVESERDEGDEAADDGVPVENAGAARRAASWSTGAGRSSRRPAAERRESRWRGLLRRRW